MLCKSCRKKTENTDVYCLNCGVPTEMYKNHFRIKPIINSALSAMNGQKDNFLLYNLLIGTLLLMVIYITTNEVLTDSYWCNYILLKISSIFIIPLMLVSLTGIVNKTDELCHKTYLKLVVFCSLVALSLFLLKLICQGDPILNIVRFILVLWVISCFFPAVFIILKNEESVIKSVIKGFIAGKYLRWHQFVLCLSITTIMIGAILLLLIFKVLDTAAIFLLSACLPISLRFAAHVMSIWFVKQAEFNLLQKDSDY